MPAPRPGRYRPGLHADRRPRAGQALFGWYQQLFTYGENVHRPECEMPTAGERWLPTRQPVVLDLWPVTGGANPSAPLTTVMNWSSIADQGSYARSLYGQKDREIASIPLAARRERGGASRSRSAGLVGAPQWDLLARGWALVDPREDEQDAVDLSGLPPRLPRQSSRWPSTATSPPAAAGSATEAPGTWRAADRWWSRTPATAGPPARGNRAAFPFSFFSPLEALAAVRRCRQDYETHSRTARALLAEASSTGPLRRVSF